ncbi:MAG: glyoxalase, partial [Dokdonella sp.]
ELETKEYGGTGYSCRDPEGHLWWFGSYDPWKAEH